MKCKKCGESKSAMEFFSNPNYRSGREPRCKLCAYKVRNEWGKNPLNAHKLSKAASNWLDSHREVRALRNIRNSKLHKRKSTKLEDYRPDELKAYKRKQWREANARRRARMTEDDKAKISQRAKDWNKAHPDRAAAAVKRYCEKNKGVIQYKASLKSRQKYKESKKPTIESFDWSI
jgi:hypothetical protein